MLALLELESTTSLPPYGYNVSMRTRRHRLLSRVGSLLVVLCLLAAPLCATRCTLYSCLQVNSHQQSAPGCHHQSAQSHTSSTLTATPALSCVPIDSFLTALPAQHQRLLPTSSNFDSSCLSAKQNISSHLLFPDLIALRLPIRDSSPGDFASSLVNEPLRL
jgi:hypothetical protein